MAAKAEELAALALSMALPCATLQQTTVPAAAWTRRRDRAATPMLLWERTGQMEGLNLRRPTW